MDTVTIFQSMISGLGVAGVLWIMKILKKHREAHEKTEELQIKTAQRLDRVESEFYPDSGKSLWDRMEATYNLLAQVAQQQGHYVRPQPIKETKETKEP